MNPAAAGDPRVSTLPDDPLFQLQLCVARRADELAREFPENGGSTRDRETWDRAEGELLPSWGGGAVK